MQHKLTNGYVLILDEEDSKILANKKWFAQKPYNGKYAYAASSFKVNGKYKILYFHRLVMNAPKGKFVDHINGNTLDCRKENLRLCDNRQNQLNQRRIRGEVPFKGVTKENGKYRARIRVNGIKKHLGKFNTPEEAAEAYRIASQKIFPS